MIRRAYPIVAALAADAILAAAAPEEFFEARVRPVLVERCGGCHGERAASGLRVTSRAALLQGGTRGAAVVPGDPEKSLLLQAVRHTHQTLQMPPAGPLPADEVSALAAWIRDGAVWPTAHPVTSATQSKKFWSFEPLWPLQGSIDRHVRAGLQAKGIPQNPRADRRTLLRRLTQDLTGLPPEPAEAEAFLKDRDPKATEKLVDRLLASPAFGERWGRHWLDVARFGEDDFTGTAPKPYPNAWRYRDWVVQAFNGDMPYDVFVEAQMAGDLLPGDRDKYIGGLGLFGLGPWYFGISQPPQARADERHDRVDMVTRGLLGLTAACARCHDHKYDPIPQTDYYALAGVFASSEYKEYPLAPADEIAAYEESRKRIQKLEKEVEQFLAAQTEQLAEIYARQTAAFLAGRPDVDQEIAGRWKKHLDKAKSDAAFLQDWPFLKDWAAAKTPQESESAAQKLQETLLAVIAEKKRMDEENRKLVIRASDPSAKRRKVILPFNYDSEADFNPGSEVPTQSLERNSFQLWNRLVGGQDAVYRVTGKDLEKRLTGEWKRHLETLRAELERAKKEQPKAYPYYHGLAEHSEPVDLRLNVRGNPMQEGEIVPRHFLTCLSDGAPRSLRDGSGRLELAETIIAHPLAARVMANRTWAWLFGAGVVRTPSNFGLMGERPANRPLLEYLAARLVERKFSLKQLIREIVLSDTYLASSGPNKAGESIDPDNRLFWRANRKRLDAEAIRDTLLAVSGELDRRQGGESAPLEDANLRRTVYVRLGRYQQNETMALFDFPSASIHAEQRAVTNVPLQKLFFLNSSFFSLRAEAFARRASTVEDAYRILFQRAPEEREKQAARDFLGSGSWAGYAQVLLSTNELLYLD